MANTNTSDNTEQETNSCFVLTLPLKDEPWQHHNLDTLFKIGNNAKNCLIADRKKALEQLERTHKWHDVQDSIRNVYQSFESEKDNYDPETAALELQKRLKPFFKIRNRLLSEYGLSDAQFQKRMIKYTKHYKKKLRSSKRVVGIIPSQAAQKIASTVWAKFSDYLFGSGKEIKFSKWTDFTAIQGKTNETGFIFVLDQGRYWDSYLYYNDMRISVKIAPPNKDRYGYQEECLKRKIKYAGIIRRWYPEGWRYFVQLTLDGEPPVNVKKDTGEVLHSLGKGPVGHDIGTQTLASCGLNNVSLFELAAKVKGIDRQLRVINRAMDRSRHATNPQMFDEKGQVVRIDKLPPECLTSDGKRRKWVQSKRYKRLEGLRRYLYRQQRDLRQQQHNAMANILMSYGDEHYVETMRFRALAKRAKETTTNKHGKFNCKKAFWKIHFQ